VSAVIARTLEEPLPESLPRPDAEEEWWICRATGGDPEACAWLLRRYRARVVRLAAHVLRRPDEAEDAAQEAFVRAFRSLRDYRGHGRFYTWLYRIVVRACIDRQRLARHQREACLEDARVADARQGVHERLLVAALLDQLSPPLRAALVLRELEGLEYEEIAAVLSVPVGTVRSRLNAARKRFRTLYERAQEEEQSV